MKIELTKRIGFFDVDNQNAIRPRVLMNLLQDVATTHTEKAGLGFTSLMAEGKAWILYQMGLHIHRAPALDDEILIQSWHSGEEGIRAYRDYLITCGNETLVSARAIWLLIDFHTKQIRQVTDGVCNRYTLEAPIFDADVFDSWKPWLRPEPSHMITLALRPSDFDSLGHVNNATYFDYLDILKDRVLGDSAGFKAVYMQYSKEIPKGTREIKAGLQEKDGRYLFKLFSDGVMHAIGDFQIISDGP